MARHYNSGIFTPKNPQKYVGVGFPTYRSSWELTLFNMCDTHPSIVQWASESIKIPYLHPFTGKQHNYIPDLLIVYVDKYGKKHAEIIEVKPLSQTLESFAKSRSDKEALIINTAKWKYAEQFCKKQGLKFRVMTEKDIYRNTGMKKSDKKTRRNLRTPKH